MLHSAGMNGEVEYTILSNDVPFVIDSRNGSIYTSRHLDREELSEYMIIVKAEDYATKGALSSTAEVSYTFPLITPSVYTP